MKNPKRVPIGIIVVSLALTLAACGATPTPTQIAVAPSDTPVPPTSTPVPPTETPVPPTDTPIPPTDTPVPPTDTPIPPTDTPVPPTDTPVPEPTEPPADDTPSDDETFLGPPPVLDSFKSSLQMAWNGLDPDGAEVSGSMDIRVEFIRDPLAQYISIGGDFPGVEELGLGDGDTLEIYVITETMYMNLMGMWMSIPAEPGSTAAFEEMAFAISEGMLDTLQDFTDEGEIDYNGMAVRHYSFDQTDFGDDDLEGMEVDEAGGNIYVAVDGNFLVHMDLSMAGSNIGVPTGEGEQVLDIGALVLEVDIYSINESFEIAVPEEALSGG
jgi:hypothetical protein